MGKVWVRNKLYTKGTTASSGGGSGTVESLIPGTNITIDNTDPANPIVSTTADDIVVVANYSALPAANTVSGEFYWCTASQGTSWLPGGLGGTYYSAGLYYSNGTTWEFLETPYQATQSEVNTGTNTNKFVTPETLNNYNGWTATKIAAGSFPSGAYTIPTSLSIPSLIGTSGQLAYTTVAQSSGAITDYLFTPSNHTGQTASTNSPVFKIAASTKTFATGAITNAYGTHIESTTLAFAASSTVTNSYGLYVEANTLGTNAVFTNTYGIGTNGFVKLGQGLTGTIIRNDVSTNNYTTFYNANITPSSSNYFIKNNSSTTFLNAITGGSLLLTYNGLSVVAINSTTAMTIAEGVTTNAGTTTGWKLCGSTTQKMALWNKTPIVQPTTAITGATLVSNAGTTITSTDTFGGYTLQQIAAALVNFGLLA